MKYQGRLLIVDDDPVCCTVWKQQLEGLGFRVQTAHDLETMKESVGHFFFDGILLDLDLGQSESGMDALPYLISESPYSKIIILTAHASIDTAVEAIQKGAHDYVQKDLAPSKVVEHLNSLLKKEPKHDKQDTSLHECLAEKGLIGESEAFFALADSIQQLARVDSTVLILGESGTGKEVVARSLHELSNRKKEHFAALNCAAIPEALLESELFGHKKGAFTDAKEGRVGIFEQCSEGTLLLDEIGDMPLNLQAKLLRVLQEKQIVPVGSSKPIPINTRIIAATHRDLKEEIENGRFRQDLYYRLFVVPLFIPPLRHRKSDVPVLFRYFLQDCCQKYGRKIKVPGPEFFKRLTLYDWPGNIRELKNCVERAVVLAEDEQIRIEDLFQHLALGPNRHADPQSQDDDKWIPPQILNLDLTKAKQAFEKQYIREVIKQSNGNITDASKKTGRYRADIYRMIDKYHIDHAQFRH